LKAGNYLPRSLSGGLMARIGEARIILFDAVKKLPDQPLGVEQTKALVTISRGLIIRSPTKAFQPN